MPPPHVPSAARIAGTAPRRGPVRLLLLVVALGLAGWWPSVVPAAWGAAFQVSPTRFEFSLERRFTDYFTVTNNSGELLRLRVTTAFLAEDDAGTLREREGHPHDLAPWLVLNPRRITLGPAEKRVVRFSVRPPAGLSPGEYRTVVFFEELPPRPEEPERDGAGFRIQILTRLGVTIYGRVGNPRADPRLEAPTVAVQADALLVKGVLFNAGAAHATLDLVATLLGEGDAEVNRAEQRLTLQREQRHAFAFTLPRPPAGTYRLRLRGLVDKQPVLDVERTVTVEPSTR